MTLTNTSRTALIDKQNFNSLVCIFYMKKINIKSRKYTIKLYFFLLNTIKNKLSNILVKEPRVQKDLPSVIKLHTVF